MRALLMGSAALLFAMPQIAQAAPDAEDVIVVTGAFTEAAPSATRSVVTGEELRARGARDLRTALATVAGADAPPGGDAGPASAVPSFWGQQELDSFLLVIDGVPSGTVFTPDVATLDLENIDRIEVARGPAAIAYGVSSFIGVVEVFHKQPGATPGQASILGGERSRFGVSGASDLPDLGALKQALSGSYYTTEFSQDRADLNRAHGLYRAALETAHGDFGFDLDVTRLRQTPYSPHPREGGGLTSRFRFDANVNPTDARQDEDRTQAAMRYRAALSSRATVFATLSAKHSDSDNTRGFLRSDFAVDGVTPNADGFDQNVIKDDAYLNARIEWRPTAALTLAVGGDYAYGRGRQRSANFEYAVLPDGSNAPNSRDLVIDEYTRVADVRKFGSAFVTAAWRATDRLSFDAAARYQIADERRRASLVDAHAPPGAPAETDDQSRTDYRWSGGAGVSYALLRGRYELDAFARYDETFKPADVDFGPEAEGDILKPEDGRSIQVGLRGSGLGGRLGWEASVFELRMRNLLIRENIDGLPALANSGKDRFRGAEVEASYRIDPALTLRGSYAYHDAEFLFYDRELDDGTLQHLKGKRPELSPRHLAGVSLTYAPASGWTGSVTAHYVGDRFLNKTNTAEASAYTTLDAALGYRWERWRVDLVGDNLTDERPPVTESELGDAQFYTLPGRVVWLRLSRDF